MASKEDLGQIRLKADQPRRVRVVAKIRAFTDQERDSSNGSSSPWISIHKPNENSSDRVTISFGDQSISRKDSYEMDCCYEQNEDSSLIYSKEIKLLISEAFDGRNVSIIAFGARSSGKTCTIQGSETMPGLATLAMTEILTVAEEKGKSVTISCYEVFQEHVYDLLDPKRPEVQLLEGAQGKIKLKGLSQVPVKSISEFQSLYFSGSSTAKAVQKVVTEQPRRSHKGLMILISSIDDQSNAKFAAKLNFVDLTGYEDIRRKSSCNINLVEDTKTNKSLYALLNVVHALNVKENRVPYRESKLTRVLQDSLGGRNHVVMLTCLNPCFCQDTIYAASLASRSCQSIQRVSTNSTNQCKGLSKLTGPSSHKKGKVEPVSDSSRKVETVSDSSRKPSSHKKGKVEPVSDSSRKQSGRQVHFSKNKACSTLKPRELFDEGQSLNTSEQTITPLDTTASMQSDTSSNIDSTMVTIVQEEEKFISDMSSITVYKEESSVAVHKEENVSPSVGSKSLSLVNNDDGIGKENKSLVVSEGEPLSLSSRIQQLSNNLKSLCSTPLRIEISQEKDNLNGGHVVPNDVSEPKTPITVNRKWELSDTYSPLETFNKHSTGMKNSLVQDYLRILNSANKEELKGLKGIGEKRATYILELREESPEPFKSLDDLKDIGLSAKQIKGMMKRVAGDLFE